MIKDIKEAEEVDATSLDGVDVVTTWEEDVQTKLTEFITNMLSVSGNCNMATVYRKKVKEVYETHTEYDGDMVEGAELRIVFDFVEPIDTKKVNLI